MAIGSLVVGLGAAVITPGSAAGPSEFGTCRMPISRLWDHARPPTRDASCGPAETRRLHIAEGALGLTALLMVTLAANADARLAARIWIRKGWSP